MKPVHQFPSHLLLLIQFYFFAKIVLWLRTTDETKLISTFTDHQRASFDLLYPRCTVRTLLIA